MKDAFDLWWEWATKTPESTLMIDGDIHMPSRSYRRKIGAIERRSTKPCADIGKATSAPKPHRPPHHHVHAADRGARGHLEFARAMKEAAN